jgi:dTDP-4-dehydrorhamnose reductase
VINAAAYTAVDKAQDDRATTFAVNRDGPAYLAEARADHGIPLIHVSTDYVFDGDKRGPYTEEDTVAPLGVYGESKRAGEDAIRDRLLQHVIPRTAWVHGIHGHDFVKTMLRIGAERDLLRVVDD